MARIHKEYLAPCGLDCGVCRIRQATEDNDLGYLKRLARIYGRRFPEVTSADADDLLCDGCRSARRFLFCRECAIRDCAQQKGYQGCHQCPDFPCSHVDEFPMPAGKKVMLRAIPSWRAHGTERWIQAEEARYRCPECNHRLFRGAQRCEHCGCQVDVN
jgi:hypothetical protein